MEKCILPCSYPVDLTADCANMLCKYENRYIQRVVKTLGIVARANFSLQRGKCKNVKVFENEILGNWPNGAEVGRK